MITTKRFFNFHGRFFRYLFTSSTLRFFHVRFPKTYKFANLHHAEQPHKLRRIPRK